MFKELDIEKLDFRSLIHPGDTVTWGQSVAEPVPLTRALVAQRHAIGRFNVFLGATYSDTCRPEHTDCITFSSYCGAGNNRLLARARKLDILPCHYSELPALIRNRQLRIDVLMLQVAPAEAQGQYSLSMAHEYLVDAVDAARVVVAEVNDRAPWTYGERSLRADDLDYIVRTSRPPLEIQHPLPGQADLELARHVASLIPDGATMQIGIGTAPELILSALRNHRDLGIHTGAIGDMVAELMQQGVITNARKTIDPGVTVAGVMFGSRRMQEFAHRNSAIQFRSVAYTHNPDVLARIESFTAINSAIEVDVTGQINAEIAGGVYVGAIGGSSDFLRAARRSKGGLPIVALRSVAGGSSRIVPWLHGEVTMPRSDACIIVTEHGIADLRGLSVSERVSRMIDITHPDFRESLEAAAFEGRWQTDVSPDS